MSSDDHRSLRRVGGGRDIGGVRLRVAGLLLLVAALTFAPASAPANEPAPPSPVDPPSRPTIGLVLSGGGARGAAHVGVLKVLEELRIPIDRIAGTSMGAIVGGLYAAGYSPDELEQALEKMDWYDLLNDAPAREDKPFRRKDDDLKLLTKFQLNYEDWKLKLPTGLIKGQKLQRELRYMTLRAGGISDFDDLPIPYRAVAADIETGHAVVLSKGDLTTAIRASMSIPGAFSPVEVDGRLLVDGGIAKNLPIQVAREMGADVLIAVNISSPLSNRDELDSILAISGQVLTVLVVGNVERSLTQLTSEDILLEPDLGDIGPTDFDQVIEAALVGEDDARDDAQELSRLGVSESEYAAFLARQRRPDPGLPTIESIRFVNDSRISDGVLEAFIDIPIGERLDTKRLEKQIDLLYGTDVFDLVTFRFDPLETGMQLVIDAQKRSSGRNRLRAALNLETSFSGETLFSVALNLLALPINDLAGEWQSDLELGNRLGFNTEFFQPLDDSGHWFASAELDTRFEQINQFDGKDRVGQIGFWNLVPGVTLGRMLSNWGQLQLGTQYLARWETERDGETQLPSQDAQQLQLLARASYDTVDSAIFPTRGQIATVEALFGREFTDGKQGNVGGLVFAGLTAHSWKRFTVSLYGEVANNFGDDDVRIARIYQLGGFRRLSGLEPQQLQGTALTFLMLQAYYPILTPRLLNLETPVYLGATFETGNTWMQLDDFDGSQLRFGGSAYLGIDTFIGPIYLAYGFTDPDRHAGYLFIGRRF